MIISKILKRPLCVLSRLSARHGGGLAGFLRAVREALVVLFNQGPLLFYDQLVRNCKVTAHDSYPISNLLCRKISENYPLRNELETYTNDIGIVICFSATVRGLRNTIDSVCNHTIGPYTIVVLVEEGCDVSEETLKSEGHDFSQVKFVLKEQSKRYSEIIGGLLPKINNENIVLLSCGTVVGPQWLDRMNRCLKYAEPIGVVSPLSNMLMCSADYDFEELINWSVPLPPDIGVQDFNRLIAKHSACAYPLLSGCITNCLFLKTKLVGSLHFFEGFFYVSGRLKARDGSVQVSQSESEIIIADDTYVFGDGIDSSLAEEKGKLSIDLFDKSNSKSRDLGHYTQKIDDAVMLGIIARTRQVFEIHELIGEAKEKWSGKKVDFVLPVSGPGGGSNVVIA